MFLLAYWQMLKNCQIHTITLVAAKPSGFLISEYPNDAGERVGDR